MKQRKNTKNSICTSCKKRKVCSIGNGRYSNLCRTCRWYKWSISGTTDFLAKRQKDTNCATCGFVPEHPRQLTVDRIDGNLSNNDLSNLQILCLNCASLKQQTQKSPHEVG